MLQRPCRWRPAKSSQDTSGSIVGRSSGRFPTGWRNRHPKGLELRLIDDNYSPSMIGFSELPLPPEYLRYRASHTVGDGLSREAFRPEVADGDEEEKLQRRIAV